MRGLKEILHDRVILLQECLHLLDQVLGLFLGPFVLISQAVYFLIKVLLNRFKLNMEALLVHLDIGLKVSLIRLIVVYVIVKDLVDLSDL